MRSVDSERRLVVCSCMLKSGAGRGHLCRVRLLNLLNGSKFLCCARLCNCLYHDLWLLRPRCWSTRTLTWHTIITAQRRRRRFWISSNEWKIIPLRHFECNWPNVFTSACLSAILRKKLRKQFLAKFFGGVEWPKKQPIRFWWQFGSRSRSRNFF